MLSYAADAAEGACVKICLRRAASRSAAAHVKYTSMSEKNMLLDLKKHVAESEIHIDI